MRKILFIESSATLRHALKKLLQRHHYQLEIIDDLNNALDTLIEKDSSAHYECIIIGWPSETHTGTDELLALFSEPPHLHIPLLLLTHEADSAKLGWVSGRTHTALLQWDNYDDTPRTLQKLLSPQFDLPFIDNNDDDTIRVLLVDDSPTARVKFRKLLQAKGYYTVTASNTNEALEKAAEENFDIAIIDYFMPDENGDALCRKLLSKPHTTNIIPAVLTSTYSDKVIQSSLAAGAVECMFKNEANDLFTARVDAMSRNIRITKRIEKERTRLEGILSSVGDGVYGTNKDGTITFVNPATCQLLGYTSDIELIGQQPRQLFHRYNDTSGAFKQELEYIEQAIREGREMHGFESIFTRTDGTPIQVEMTIFPLHIGNQHQGTVVAFRDVSVRKLLEEELKWQANHDPLTKLLNRKYLEDALEEEVKRAQRSDETGAFLYIDLDRFKYINDTIGHTAGDQLLIDVGNQLQSRMRKSDLLGRLGGDEFGILLRNINSDDLYDVADNFRELLSDYPFVRDGRSYKINASIGVAMIEKATANPGEVLSNADIACHIAKGQGRNNTHVYTQEQDNKAAMDMELGWSFRLHQALEKNNFHLYFQPILALQDLDVDDMPADDDTGLCQYLLEKNKHACKTYEVLLRLHNGYGEPITPNAFLPTAERFNMMKQIDTWVINAAMEKMAELGDAGEHITFTINISGQSLAPDSLVPIFRKGIKKHKLNPERFLFEITESCAINDTESACYLINELSELGCRFALDDFGSGYCSFSHLKRLPVDYIKIDGMFVKDIINDPMDMAIVRSITSIAHTLGKKTVAEFVESAETIRLLKECGVDFIQGYYVSHPLSELPLPDINTKTGSDADDIEQNAG